MRDWRRYVRDRLPELGDRVVQELAGHLDDVYSDLRSSGLSEPAACEEASKQVGDWLELRRGIQATRQEVVMQERVKQFWLPSLVTLVLGWGILTVVIWAGVRPLMTRPGQPEGLYVYWPWLVALPFVGALGAYLSRQAEMKGWKVYVAGTFPALAIAIVFLLILPWGFVVDSQVAPALKLTGFAAGIVSWVLLPGIALCLGIAAQGRRFVNRAKQ